eukprot:scaffold1384_cov116-Cylindrotheca_fusiformis.AAC.20
MEESYSNHASPISSSRARSIAKLLATFALGLGAWIGPHASQWFSSTLSTSSSIGDQRHYLRTMTTTSTSTTWERLLQEASNETCSIDCCEQYRDTFCPDQNAWIEAIPFWLQIVLIALFLCLSALFSGLTLGLMSLDKTGLEIVMGGDDAKAANYAQIIYPVRLNGNLLLCTLLLGNVAVNALLSIFMADFAGGIVGFISSTFLIVIFGEIVPQALWCLDLALGRELTTTYSNAEMLKLLQIHVQENVLDKETAGAMTGALTYKNITVKEAMTPLERTFMLNVDDKLSFETIATVFKTGYSRIPVYEVSKNNIIGLLFVKDLIFVDPEDAIPIRSFVQIFGRGVHVVWPDDHLGDVLTELKKGKSHLALVRDVNNDDKDQDPYYEIKGLITLEDIIERIIGDSIVDETDAFIDNSQKIKVERAESFEWARLRLLDSKIIDGTLSESEVQAVTAHLRVNYAPTVSLLTDFQLRRLVASTPVTQLNAAERTVGKELPDDLLYEKDKPSDECLLILSGKVTILVGSENFRSELSAWSVLGKAALENSNFTPDFTAYVSDGPCKCLRFRHKEFVEAVDASAIERQIPHGSVIPPPEELSVATSGGGDAVSVGSSEAPNRREKLIAKIFKKGSNVDEEKHHEEAPKPKREMSVHFGGVLDSSRRSSNRKATEDDSESAVDA